LSDDPETARQIAELASDGRPLLVLDVDDVVLDFDAPFPRYLEANGYELRLETFRLHGNIYHRDSGEPAEQDRVAALISDFFQAQAEWQTVTTGAAEALAALAADIEIVLLTAMPHRHREARRAHLDALGLNYPLLTTEMAKGPAILSLRGGTERPVAFVDDQLRNLVSAAECVPDAHLFHLMADNSLRAFLPEPPDGIRTVEDWDEARPLIAAALGV